MKANGSIQAATFIMHHILDVTYYHSYYQSFGEVIDVKKNSKNMLSKHLINVYLQNMLISFISSSLDKILFQKQKLKRFLKYLFKTYLVSQSRLSNVTSVFTFCYQSVRSCRMAPQLFFF